MIATDAPVNARQLGRLTRRVPLCLISTGTHGGHGSVDLAIAFSTAQRIPHDTSPLVNTVTVLSEQHPLLDAPFAAVVEVTEEAVTDAFLAGHPVDGCRGHRQDVLPLEETLTIPHRHRVAASPSSKLPPIEGSSSCYFSNGPYWKCGCQQFQIASVPSEDGSNTLRGLLRSLVAVTTPGNLLNNMRNPSSRIYWWLLFHSSL